MSKNIIDFQIGYSTVYYLVREKFFHTLEHYCIEVRRSLHTFLFSIILN